MMHRGFRYKLAPTPQQQGMLEHFAGVTRLVYNLAWEQRRDFWRQYLRITGRRLNFANQGLEITDLRKEYDWIAVVPYDCLVQSLRDLDRAFDIFFKGEGKYPTPRCKGINDSFRLPSRNVSVRRLNGKWSEVRVPKLGWIKFRDTRPMVGALCNITISRDPLGWFISFTREIEHHAETSKLPSVGIDRGVANTLSLSTGEHLSVPASLATIDSRHRRAQRVLARRKKGSKRRLRQLRKCARLSAKRARIRRDWHHRVALDIARRFGTVVMEDLKISNMTASAAGTVETPGRGVRAKAGLNRSILNQGWYTFETILAYKLEERGGTLVKVPAAYTSQTCSECGTIDSRSRESQAIFRCRHCGFKAHADHNAAINILRGNTPSMRAEGCRQAPVETRTGLSREVHENHPALVA